MSAHRRQRGFTSLDLLFILAVLLGITALSGWLLWGAYWQGNELAAMTTLRLVGQSQKTFHARHQKYASLEELASPETEESAGLHSSVPPQLARDRQLKGYLFQVVCAVTRPAPVPEDAAGVEEETAPAPTVAEPVQNWCAYAWPATYGLTGFRTFLIDDSGTVYSAVVPELGGIEPSKLDPGIGYRGRECFGDVTWAPVAAKTR